jgi:hypothetical protein
MLESLPPDVAKKLFSHQVRIPGRRMNDDEARRGSQRLQNALDRIQSRFEPHIVSVPGVKYPSDPRYKAITVTGEPTDRAANPIVGLLLETLDDVGRCEESHLAGLQLQKIKFK